MTAVNPTLVLRNYLAQQVIDRAEAGDYAAVRELQHVVEHPFQDDNTALALASLTGGLPSSSTAADESSGCGAAASAGAGTCGLADSAGSGITAVAGRACRPPPEAARLKVT
jgi:hypothetical protein